MSSIFPKLSIGHIGMRIKIAFIFLNDEIKKKYKKGVLHMIKETIKMHAKVLKYHTKADGKKKDDNISSV